MLALAVEDPSQVADARRRVSEGAAAAGFGSVRVGQVALAVTELSTNLIKHGGGGQLLAGVDDDRVALLALDRGPGMADVGACLADGFSTAGTRGAGLGAVRRLAQFFEVASWPGRGTVVLAEILRESAPISRRAAYALALAKAGEDVSGDGWSVALDPDGLTLFVVDGLGHGTEAAIVANEAVKQFQAHRREAPADIIAAVHRGLRHTRGGAVACSRLRHTSRTATFAGLGNIAACCVGGDNTVRRMVSMSGIAGHNARRIQAFEYPCTGGLLVMHSDGISTSWTLNRYPGLATRHPLLVAGVLYRDFTRGSDDVTIVVARTEMQ